MPHHSTASSTAGNNTAFPIRQNSRGYQHQHAKSQSIQNVLRGRLHRPFQKEGSAQLIIRSASPPNTTHYKYSPRTRPIAETKLTATVIASLPSASSSIVETLLAARQSLSRGSSNLHRLKWTQDLDNFDDEREHAQNGMSPWNEATMIENPIARRHVTEVTEATEATPPFIPFIQQTATTKHKETRKRLPSISMELQGLFAQGSRIDKVTTPNSNSSNNNNDHDHDNDDEGLKFTFSDIGQIEGTRQQRPRALSPFSEWLDQKRTASPETQPPMSADCIQSERYQLLYNRASTVTASGKKSPTKTEQKRALKELNQKRATSLLEELKKTIYNKKLDKKRALVEHNLFSKEIQLRERISKPLPPPSNCQLPRSFAPNHHTSHPSFTAFYPASLVVPSPLTHVHAKQEDRHKEPVFWDDVGRSYPERNRESLNNWERSSSATNATNATKPTHPAVPAPTTTTNVLQGKSLSHARLSAYRFNVLTTTPFTHERTKEKEHLQHALLESQGAEQRQKLATSFWTQLRNQEEAERMLSWTLQRVAQGKTAAVDSVDREERRQSVDTADRLSADAFVEARRKRSIRHARQRKEHRSSSYPNLNFMKYETTRDSRMGGRDALRRPRQHVFFPTKKQQDRVELFGREPIDQMFSSFSRIY